MGWLVPGKRRGRGILLALGKKPFSGLGKMREARHNIDGGP